MTQQVYILEDKKSGLLKVGISVDVLVRVGQINKAFGCNAEVIGVLDVANAAKTERFIHGMLGDCRVVGEWFEVDDSRRGYLLTYFDAKPAPPKKKSPGRKECLESQTARGRSSFDEIRAKLRQKMAAEGLTQEQVADSIGIAPPNLSRMLKEGGSGATPRNWQALYDFLGFQLTLQPKADNE